MANRGLKRMCASCGTMFYDLNKDEIICPSCGAVFTGEVKVKTRKAKSAIVPDTVKREDAEKKNQDAAELEDETISLNDVDDENTDDLDEEALDADLDLDDLDEGGEDDDDLSDLDGDIDVDLDIDDDDR